MNAFFDIRTLCVAIGAINLVTFLFMFYVYRTSKTYPGFLQWTLGSFFSFAGMILLSLRGVIPDFASILIANSLTLSYVLLVTHGILKFADRTIKWGPFLVPGMLLISSFWYFTYYFPSVNARIIIYSIIVGLFYLWSCYLVYRPVSTTLNKLNIFLFVIFAFHALWFLLRVVYTITFEPTTQNFLLTSIVQRITFLVTAVCNVATTMGLIVLNSDRLELELKTAMEEIKTLRGNIPICASCKKVRDDKGYWNQIESYIETHTEALFSHGLCLECQEKIYGNQEWFQKKKNRKNS